MCTGRDVQCVPAELSTLHARHTITKLSDDWAEKRWIDASLSFNQSDVGISQLDGTEQTKYIATLIV